MPRKSLATLDLPKKAADQFAAATLENYQLAKAAYDHQDAKTKAAIDGILKTLQAHAHGKVNVKVANSLVAIKVNDETLGYHLFGLAIQVASDLAFVGLRVANFKFDPKVCAACGTKIVRRR